MRVAAPEHTVPAGPLAVRWLASDVPAMRAGRQAVCVVELENAGTARWRVAPPDGIHLGYHWLDLQGNPIVWGVYTPLPLPVEPGARLEAAMPVRAPRPPGAYRLAFDLVDEGRLWFSDVGNPRLERDVDVSPRLAGRRLGVSVGRGLPDLMHETEDALARQEEAVYAEDGDVDALAFLVAGCRPRSDWSRRILDLHAEGFAFVGGGVDLVGLGRGRRQVAQALAPWLGTFGRAPRWSHPLLCPSTIGEFAEIPPWTDPVTSLPAFDPTRIPGEPWLCDGRIRVAVSPRAARQAGLRPS